MFPINENQVTNLVADLAAKAPRSNPVFTGTVTGVTKTHVGLGNVDNIRDQDKQCSAPQQTAINNSINAMKATPLHMTTTLGQTTNQSFKVTDSNNQSLNVICNATAGGYNPMIHSGATSVVAAAGSAGTARLDLSLWDNTTSGLTIAHDQIALHHGGQSADGELMVQLDGLTSTIYLKGPVLGTADIVPTDAKQYCQKSYVDTKASLVGTNEWTQPQTFLAAPIFPMDSIPKNRISNLVDDLNNRPLKSYVDIQVGLKAPKDSPEFTGKPSIEPDTVFTSADTSCLVPKFYVDARATPSYTWGMQSKLSLASTTLILPYLGNVVTPPALSTTAGFQKIIYLNCNNPTTGFNCVMLSINWYLQQGNAIQTTSGTGAAYAYTTQSTPNVVKRTIASSGNESVFLPADFVSETTGTQTKSISSNFTVTMIPSLQTVPTPTTNVGQTSVAPKQLYVQQNHSVPTNIWQNYSTPATGRRFVSAPFNGGYSTVIGTETYRYYPLQFEYVSASKLKLVFGFPSYNAPIAAGVPIAGWVSALGFSCQVLGGAGGGLVSNTTTDGGVQWSFSDA